HILIRTHLADTLGMDAAGYWEAMWRLSAAYLMLVTTTLSLYYLPKLSELKDPKEIKAEILQGYKIILPVAAACGLVIYLLRDFIIGVLFTSDFIPMRDLFAWQMVGDTLKIGSWLLGYVLIAKSEFKFVMFTEVVFAVLFYFFINYFIAKIGLEGSAVAHALNYFLHMITMFLYLSAKRII